jgi:hypothetical protein
MLRFQKKPDKVLTEIVTLALEEAIDSTQQDDFGCVMHLWDEDIHRAFGTTAFLGDALEKLLEAHKSPDVFMPTDWHFLLLDRILRSWCDCYNDMEDHKEASIKDPDGNIIEKIDTEALFWFFWDDDYDFDPKTAVGLRHSLVKDIADVSDTAINASLRKPVDLGDLVLEKWDPDKAFSENDDDENEPWWDEKKMETLHKDE